MLKTPMKMDGKPGNGPLHVFARQSQPELVEYFLRRGVSPNERNDWLNTPLHQALGASGYGSTAIGGIKVELCVKKLLDAGADPNARNLADETPLMIAGRHSAAIARMLLAKGADVNAVAKVGGKNRHVLDYFSEKHNLEGFEALVKAGASKAK